MSPLRPLTLLLLATAVPVPGARAAADALPPGFVAGETVRPVEALDGDTLRLADGRELRLAVIEAPKRPLDVAADRPWPIADAARSALAELALERDWSLVPAGTPRDRYGRLLGHLVDAEGTWLNGELVAAGLARAVSRADLRLGARRLLEIERLARARRLGLWSLQAYRVLPAEEARFGLNRFALVEGRVLAVATVRGRTYLNFGEDWRTDFTVSLEPAARRLFEREGVDLENYQGLRLRVRGWLQPVNGPMIEVTHPEQLEVLE
ncbi:Endonuclease YncB, thermonuclease family [Tistlia consotensis]|uniref:Endonuclease YncB, thermonuclease family n=1 Tax=Tistlia consotensis USBA 355 TaxID=560819 RepID=A0A1Y6C169_9PROT|nr:thermonuclease family protein [Tistlia consotensis]SMF38482.1 Endonuclease YncB, thermonuclease family [Tistlia consotensis USBA 355]SNR37124.1 Endonuclease YncB, thermonuclease family [Tistlia consotensis]